ncbi:cadherin-86C isoform X2 [Neocloeon triangulifer]|uniref:cadherin-86C isoform X2 n=1 Tax=Neocloeon triangulifer TaxID=2078957 RepID=UPI00286EFBF0|nr:cadherin-86C isoform X2 [Neocloeon triangulifer]
MELRVQVWLVLAAALAQQVAANYPLFDESTKMRVLLVPWDTRVGSAIYRVRATDSDYDYPLSFDVQGRTGRSLLRVENLPCARNYSVCEANVILAKPLEKNRLYQFTMSVRDAQGDQTNVEATLRATPGSSVAALDTAFPRYSTLIMVPENTKVGAELEYFLVRKSNLHARHAYLELNGASMFKMKQRLAGNSVSNGSVILMEELDYEKQNLYPLHMAATDPFTNSLEDTRNILGFDLAVVVSDVQDTPPVFIQAPPVTSLPATIRPGDMILKVMAEDGDKGNPREIRYGLLTQGNPFTPFFRIGETSGELRLTRSLDDLRAIIKPNTPVVLRVIAEEVVTGGRQEDNPEHLISTEAELALILPGSTNKPPMFESESYVASIPEDSSPGTPLTFTDPWLPRVRDNDVGLGGVFSLSLMGDNGTFEISPSVVEGSANFIIRVKNNAMLDYEKYQTLNFKILAKEVNQPGNGALSALASVTVMVSDVNDNPPLFSQPNYAAVLPENATAGTPVTQVHAEDVDTGVYGEVRYTRILGQLNESLNLDPYTGQVTVAANNHRFDREIAPEFKFYVEARDEGGGGRASTVPLVISLIDVNDHSPRFEYSSYDLYLSPDNNNFSTRVFLKATDGDAEAPNNAVRYEIISGNFANKFYLDPITGELKVIPRREDRENLLKPQEPSLYTLLVRAYDLGVPHRWGTAEVRIKPAIVDASPKGSVVFIVPNSPTKVLSDLRATEKLLMQLTGGKVNIKEVRPFKPGETLIAADLAPGASHTDKSVVVAEVSYTGEPAIVDVAEMQQRLMANQTPVVTKAVITEYRADTSALFWFMVFFTLALLVALIALVICFLFAGCPLYIERKEPPPPPPPPPRPTEEVRLVLERPDRVDGDKFVIRREAWSADGRDRYVQFNRRNVLTLDPKPQIQDSYSTRSEKVPRHHERPNVIYTRELQNHDMKVYDDESVIHTDTPMALDLERPHIYPRKGNFNSEVLFEEADEDSSVRRHEMERGSDIARRIIPSHNTGVVEVLTLPDEDREFREQHYTKAGNAEVLRLFSHQDDDEDSQTRQMGKDMIMRRFMEDQSIRLLETDDDDELLMIGRQDTEDQDEEDDVIEGEYIAADTKANMLRRQSNKEKNRSRSQSLPRQQGGLSNLSKKKSMSNSGLEKASKVTFASPSVSDGEDDDFVRNGSRADSIKKAPWKVEDREGIRKTVLKKPPELKQVKQSSGAAGGGGSQTKAGNAAQEKKTGKAGQHVSSSFGGKKEATGNGGATITTGAAGSSTDVRHKQQQENKPKAYEVVMDEGPQQSKVEEVRQTRDSSPQPMAAQAPAQPVRKAAAVNRSEEVKSRNSLLQPSSPGTSRKSKDSRQHSPSPRKTDHSKSRRGPSKSPSPPQHSKRGEHKSSNKDDVKSKHTKTSLNRVEKSVNGKQTGSKNSQPRVEVVDATVAELVHGVADGDTESKDGGGEEERGEERDEPRADIALKEAVESSIQTDVTLVPLINSTRAPWEDDLDSGIAMGEERSKRLAYLTNKKSIFTIAYNDVGIPSIRADSASPLS